MQSSPDESQRLQKLNEGGMGLSRALNTTGEYYVWASFLVGFAKRVALDRFYFLPVALLILSLALNVAGRMRSIKTGTHQW